MQQIPISGYETNYDITDTGKVFSKISGKYLTPTIDTDGYKIVGLFLNGTQKKKKVHRLVAEAFIPNPNNYNQVNHKDENPQNNNVDNLEWCDCQYNINYGTRNNKVADKIKHNSNIKRTPVACYTLDGDLVKIYPSLYSVIQDGFNKSCVQQACKKIGYKTHKGFVWKYVDDSIRGDAQ